MRANRRPEESGFTMVELAIVLSCMSVMSVAVYQWWRVAESGLHESLAQIETADASRAVSEELRRDLLTMTWTDASSLALRGPCGDVAYALENGTVHRRAAEACGGSRALARRVESLRRTPAGVEVTWARFTRAGSEPFRMRILIGDGGAK